MSDIVISGYHGFANSGDEALLYAILTTLRKTKPDLDVTVLSKIPEETSREYGVKSVYRYNFLKIKKKSDNQGCFFLVVEVCFRMLQAVSRFCTILQ